MFGSYAIGQLYLGQAGLAVTGAAPNSTNRRRTKTANRRSEQTAHIATESGRTLSKTTDG